MLSLTFRMISGHEVKMNVDPSLTIEKVKEQLVRTIRGGPRKMKCPFTTQQHYLVFQSRILKDSQIISEVGLEPTSIIYIQPKARQSSPNVKRFHKRTDVETLSPSFAPPPNRSHLNPSTFEENVNKLLEFGYSREDCEKALSSAFNDPFLAAEYLANYGGRTPPTFPTSQVPINEPPFVYEGDSNFEKVQPRDISEFELNQLSDFQNIEDPETGEVKHFDLATIIQVYKMMGCDPHSAYNCLISMTSD
ncbi:hypothetical protein TRFO_10423 [Tritrichomonas foetus]|uniref:UBA/TS-N domain containing protein n=1 Tax=Tritrichomonas foetus TaxID=1144522 RepID=A0A1J4JDM6_9EUKA|nr:hypothetical protein TRFO_10423 [Tritrichomonas foetus]|eukprot:OHS95541.1 hypothetical protein TRFO_10423 [Tritrichomonas foetus]